MNVAVPGVVAVELNVIVPAVASTVGTVRPVDPALNVGGVTMVKGFVPPVTVKTLVYGTPTSAAGAFGPAGDQTGGGLTVSELAVVNELPMASRTVTLNETEPGSVGVPLKVTVPALALTVKLVPVKSVPMLLTAVTLTVL